LASNIDLFATRRTNVCLRACSRQLIALLKLLLSILQKEHETLLVRKLGNKVGKKM